MPLIVCKTSTHHTRSRVLLLTVALKINPHPPFGHRIIHAGGLGRAPTGSF
jgi:hypothetical protein